MSTFWGGSYNSLRLGHTPRRARRVIGLRRPMTADGSVLGSPARRGPVTFSEWRGVLDALAALPQIASGGCGGGASSPPDALTSERTRFASLAGASRVRSVPYDGRRML